jgi:deoxyribodipyrimidine photo-lyase
MLGPEMSTLELSTTDLYRHRVRAENDAPWNASGGYVLYWMTAARRTRFNFGLQRAVEHALELRKPLLVLEALRVDYPYASDRLHAFVVDGMRDNARAFSASRATYFPYVEPLRGAARGLLTRLCEDAATVVTDWFPGFFLPRMLRAVAAKCGVRLESVDSNGLIPVAAHGRAFPTARGYRAFVQQNLREFLASFPLEDPLRSLARGRFDLPAAVMDAWPPLDVSRSTSGILPSLPIDHTVGPVRMQGGSAAARTQLTSFIRSKLARYESEGNDPDADCTSRLSPYLHFGHISAHEIFSEVMTHEGWTTRKLGNGRAGIREGWWNAGEGADHFLEQLVVWRELAFNAAAWSADVQSYESLPAWARTTLENHLDDPRPALYSLEQLDAAETEDDVWNAAQNELRETGWFHGYMRMVWGKKMLEWCEHPREALGWMEALMNRYSLDGRDPVSCMNYAWVLGRYDRPWFERPIFGTVRCMTTASARRKLKMKNYLARFANRTGQ